MRHDGEEKHDASFGRYRKEWSSAKYSVLRHEPVQSRYGIGDQQNESKDQNESEGAKLGVVHRRSGRVPAVKELQQR